MALLFWEPIPRATALSIGDYRVTVQWFAKVDNPEKDDGVMPRNQLPAKYARAETSGLSVHIQEGENKIPTILLARKED